MSVTWWTRRNANVGAVALTGGSWRPGCRLPDPRPAIWRTRVTASGHLGGRGTWRRGRFVPREPGGDAMKTFEIRRHRTCVLVATAALAFPISLPAAEASPACIDVGGACFGTLDAALAAAVDGDTVRLPAGTFAGGATVTTSITIVGAGQGETTLSGGGPVLTVGEFGDPTPPSVTIRDLTITGGQTTTGALSEVLFGQAGVWATGGGLSVPPSSFHFDTGELGLGATVRLVHTTLEGNGAAPTSSVDSGLPCPGGQDCPFALASGGGIDTSGDLTLDHSVVRDNHVGAASGITDLASDNEGGGIRSWAGDLTVTHSRIEDNSATGTAPNARFAEGGYKLVGAPFVFDGNICQAVSHLGVGL